MLDLWRDLCSVLVDNHAQTNNCHNSRDLEPDLRDEKCQVGEGDCDGDLNERVVEDTLNPHDAQLPKCTSYTDPTKGHVKELEEKIYQVHLLHFGISRIWIKFRVKDQLAEVAEQHNCCPVVEEGLPFDQVTESWCHLIEIRLVESHRTEMRGGKVRSEVESR